MNSLRQYPRAFPISRLTAMKNLTLANMDCTLVPGSVSYQLSPKSVLCWSRTAVSFAADSFVHGALAQETSFREYHAFDDLRKEQKSLGSVIHPLQFC
jgi:hypothetical protein